MLQRGWLDEARKLKEEGVDRAMAAMKAIGYRELFDVLDGLYTLSEAREKIVVRTRQYAKRQVTWMKKYRTT
jgi:tRNA dimethylallyltransferase